MSRVTAFIAVDLGSSSGRVMLGTVSPPEGEGSDSESSGSYTLQQVHRFANIPLQPGESGSDALAWDAHRLFDETLDGMSQAVELARERQLQIAGIGVDAWGVDYGRIGRDGELLPPVRHHRGADHSMPVRSAEAVDPAVAYRITGVLDQSINTSHQLRTDAETGVDAPASTLLLVPDLWVYWLTGTRAAERTIASTTQLLDRRTGQWSQELTEAWGITTTLPPLVDDKVLAGDTSPAVTARIGADRPLPVYFVAGHDTASAFAAAGGIEAGAPSVVGVVSCGSWAVTGIAIDRPVLADDARLLGFTQELGAEGATLLVRNLSGMWLLQECMRTWTADDVAARDRPAADLLALLDAAAGIDHPAVLDVADENLQRPGRLPDRITELCLAAGYPRPASRAHIVRIIVRSLAVAYADTLREATRLVGKQLAGVRIVGGGARNRLLCQLTAEATGLEVEAGPAEASSLGILFTLAVAAGTLPDMKTARELAPTDDDSRGRFIPGPARKEATP